MKEAQYGIDYNIMGDYKPKMTKRNKKEKFSLSRFFQSIKFKYAKNLIKVVPLPVIFARRVKLVNFLLMIIFIWLILLSWGV